MQGCVWTRGVGIIFTKQQLSEACGSGVRGGDVRAMARDPEVIILE